MTRRYMLDTDAISFAIRGERGVGARILEHPPTEICVSSISVAELRFGAERRRSKRLHALIDGFLEPVEVLPFDDAAALQFAVVACALADEGTPIGEFDTLIAAHAVSRGLILVTNNTKHFSKVRGLKAENWSSR